MDPHVVFKDVLFTHENLVCDSYKFNKHVQNMCTKYRTWVSIEGTLLSFFENKTGLEHGDY
jgi:hypothetical protein